MVVVGLYIIHTPLGHNHCSFTSENITVSHFNSKVNQGKEYILVTDNYKIMLKIFQVVLCK